MLCGEKNGNGFITENGSVHFEISVCPFCCLYVSAVLFSVVLKGFRTQQNALWRGVTQYYALEGHYPETLDDLTENCGIQYDKKQFFIDYQIAGANILPDITVIER